jgi:ectoine hydroxylase-related dioxygenase (phytanoyl-CoA dioxygenase family)
MQQTHLNELYKNGFAIVNNVLQLDNTDVETITNFAKTQFGYSLHNKNNDHKRSQIHFGNNQVNCISKYHDILRQMLPDYKIENSSIIKSKSGCNEQDAHIDYCINDAISEKFNESKIPPINAMFAIERGSKLKVYPKSHKIFKSVKPKKAIKPIYVRLNKGSVLFFRGDVVHAGCAYLRTNHRIHTFLKPKNNKFNALSSKGLHDYVVKHFPNNIKKLIRT